MDVLDLTTFRTIRSLKVIKALQTPIQKSNCLNQALSKQTQRVHSSNQPRSVLWPKSTSLSCWEGKWSLLDSSQTPTHTNSDVLTTNIIVLYILQTLTLPTEYNFLLSQNLYPTIVVVSLGFKLFGPVRIYPPPLRKHKT